MRKSIRRLHLPLLLALAFLACSPIARATPGNKAALERYFDRFLASNLRNCTTCHLPSDKKDPESLDEFPHNSFGAAVRLAGKELRAAGKKRDMESRLGIVGHLDSDHDGVDNLTELLLGHNPGDANDVPTQAELADGPAKQAEFAVFLKSYRWRPFEPVSRPAIGPIPPGGNGIDAFVAEQLASHGLTFSAPAPRPVLLRRVYLDLIGLNPTPQEITAFVNDSSSDAYEKVVDRLLADPRYGERWGRHWMDIWRYSDWAGWSGGNQIRDSQPFIWRWRDWIIESLNQDKGYDQMLLEMLAADEAYPGDPKALRATGFLVRNYKMLSREQWLEDTINHTSRAFLGLTMHCAKCHDHKFDPVTQEEYYRMRAIFEPHNVRTDPVPGQPDKKLDGLVQAYDKDLDAKTFLYIRGDERNPDKKRGALEPGVPAVLGGELEIKPVHLPFAAAHPDRCDFVRADLLTQARKALEAADARFSPIIRNGKLPAVQRSTAQASLAVAQAQLSALAAQLQAEALEDAGQKGSAAWKAAASDALIGQRKLAVAEATQALLAAQNAEKPAADKIQAAQLALAKAVAELNEPASTAYKPRSTDDFPDTSTGRRLAFARWLADSKNPLTARVAANHIWARHFGTGIVPSVDDFGRNGRPATHPALLDYLASELMANGWHMKAIHRLVVTSATYRQSSTLASHQSALASDPDDTWLWRFPSRRMEAELVRDNLLYCSGQLDLTMGGAEIDHTQGLVSRRRSVYLQLAPEKEVEFLQIFDGPNPNECYFRRPSVMPQQALALANSQVAIEQSRILSARLSKEFPAPDDFIQQAFLRVLARRAAPEELSACRAFLANPKLDPTRARDNLVLVLFNHNDFVTIR